MGLFFSRSSSGSVVGAFFGFLMFAGSFPLLFWNEGRAVKTARSLDEGAKIVVAVNAAAVDPANDGKLIHISGDATTGGQIADPVLRIPADALLIERRVEKYQWKESSDTNSHGNSSSKSYSYRLEWMDSPKDSANFHERTGHENSKSFIVQSGAAMSPSARIGAFRLPPDILGKLPANQPILITEAGLALVPGGLRERLRTLPDGGLYLGKNPAEPQPGDEQIHLRILAPGPLSVIARQAQSAVAEYTTKNGRQLALVQTGSHPASDMFQKAMDDNRVLTWVLRGVGAFLTFLGTTLLVRPLTSLFSWIPFFGGIMNLGTALLGGVVAVVGAAVTIAVAWFAYRPMLSVGLLVIAIAAIYGARRFASKRSVAPKTST